MALRSASSRESLLVLRAIAVDTLPPCGTTVCDSRNAWRKTGAPERRAARRRREALETIDEDPIIGAPLFEPLRGYWSYRSEGIRIIYRIVTEARFIVVLNIGLVMAR